MIIRINKSENYTTIANEIARRKDISARAMGVYYYLMTLPDNWKVFKGELHKHFTEGRDAINKAFKELQDAGYIVGTREQNEAGKMAGYDYTIYETSDHVTEKPSTDNQGTGNPHLLNTNEPSTNNTKGKSDALKTLRKSVQEAFLNVLEKEGKPQSYFDFKVEGGHINKLVAKFMKEPDPEIFAKTMIQQYYYLTHGRDKFYSTQPFLPSRLNAQGIYPQVIDKMQDLLKATLKKAAARPRPADLNQPALEFDREAFNADSLDKMRTMREAMRNNKIPTEGENDDEEKVCI